MEDHHTCVPLDTRVSVALWGSEAGLCHATSYGRLCWLLTPVVPVCVQGNLVNLITLSRISQPVGSLCVQAARASALRSERVERERATTVQEARIETCERRASSVREVSREEECEEACEEERTAT